MCPTSNRKLIRLFWRLGVVWGLLGAFGATHGATTSGTLRVDETWEGVVQVTGDVVVPEGRTLVIKPNAVIKFAAGRDDQSSGYDAEKCELIIEGTLKAEGKEKYEIRFTSSSFTLPGESGGGPSQPQSGDWYGIVFRKGLSDRSIISNSIIEYGYDGVTCINASPRLFRNRIEANYWNGILCDILSSPKINNNQILNNGYAGVNCKIQSSPSISSNEISGNRYGVLVQDVSAPVIGDLRLGENIGKNAIYGNLEYNLYNHTKQVVYAQRNDWGDNANADRWIRDDDENRKYGLVVYTPVFNSGKVSYLEFQSLAATVPSVTEGDRQKKQQEELAVLKKQVEEQKALTTSVTGTTTAVTGKPKESLAELKKKEEQQKEAERLRLLEEQLKQQEQIRLEQERQLALKKQQEEEEKKIMAASLAASKKETKTVAAATFVATKMVNELDNQPKPVKKVSPVLPDLAKQAKISGTVSLRVLVGTDGKPEEIYIAKRIGNKDFDQMINDEAIATIKQWAFEPGISGGQTVKYWTIVNLLFK